MNLVHVHCLGVVVSLPKTLSFIKDRLNEISNGNGTKRTRL